MFASGSAGESGTVSTVDFSQKPLDSFVRRLRMSYTDLVEPLPEALERSWRTLVPGNRDNIYNLLS